MKGLDGDKAFAAYEAVRHRLPQGNGCTAAPLPAASLDEIAESYDAFLLDAFGVLNIGDSAIPDVAGRIARLRKAGKRVIVVTNAAGLTLAGLEEKYARLGYDFLPNDIVSSRAVMLPALHAAPAGRLGVMAPRGKPLTDLAGLDLVSLGDDPSDYAAADAFALLGSGDWTEARQALLEAALIERPRPVYVGNPDIVAPREWGFSVEPGHFAHRLADSTGVRPMFFGKPFPAIYDRAFARLAGIARDRVVMVGDSLHTDILGAQAAGIASALITGYGFFAGRDASRAIDLSGIRPTHVLDRP